MATLPLRLAFYRTRTYQFWMRLRYANARIPQFKPLMRAEFSNGDLFTQADFLLRAGYYNAAVCMSRLAVEKRLKRLSLISPRWREFRCKTSSGMVNFLFTGEVIKHEERRQIGKFLTKANSAVHETVVDKHTASRILMLGECLRPIVDAATSAVLHMDK